MHTFAFVDIVGFSAYTARRGDAEGARLAVGVGGRIRELLPDHGVEEVKSLGDGVMLRADDPASALRLAARLAREAEAGRLPWLRIGVDSGPAVAVDGDWYGATVNRAARLCAAARPGEVLVGARARSAANGTPAVAFRRRLARVRDMSLRAPVYAALPMRPEPRAAGAGVDGRAPASQGLVRRLRTLACPKHAMGRPA